jgi:hypothetical protein
MSKHPINMFSSLFNKQTGIHDEMEKIMLNPNHNRPQITASVIHVRNYKTGRGLRDLTWSLLFTIAQKNWHLAFTIMENIVITGAGTWKDPRDFALFCNKYGYSQLLEPLMELYVKQLLIDLRVYNKSASKLQLSFAAKYAPRERSLLHPIIMRVWNRLHPLCMRIGDKSANKCAMIYRQSVSGLNRALETTEIAMCEQAWDSLTQSKIPLQTQMKYMRCFTNKIVGFSDAHFLRAIPDWKILKYAYETRDIKWQTLWNDRISQIKQSKYVVPCINLQQDILEYKNQYLFYKAVATALLTAKKSLFSQFVMVFSYITYMVDLAGLSLIDIIDNIRDVVQNEINPCIICGTEVIEEALKTAEFTENEIANVQIQLISCAPVDVQSSLNVQIEYV